MEKLHDLMLVMMIVTTEEILQERLQGEVFGFRRGRQATGMICVINQAVAFSRPTGQTPLIAKLENTKAFDAAHFARARTQQMSPSANTSPKDRTCNNLGSTAQGVTPTTALRTTAALAGNGGADVAHPP